MKLRKFILIPAIAMTLLLPLEAMAATVSPSKPAIAFQSARYTYISDAAIGIDETSSGATVFTSVSGYSSVTKISGTMTLYKINANGGRTKVQSWSVSATGSELYAKKTVKLSSGTYIVTFSGKVTAGSQTESISLETTETDIG